MAAAIAKRGFPVVGSDVIPRAVELINTGRAPVDETDLEITIQANRERLRATLDTTEAVLASDVTFVVVPTPSDDRGAFSLAYAKAAFTAIGKALAQKDGYHLVVMSSTVLPGATRHGLIPLLESNSGKQCGSDFGVCYSPEFIALGSVIRDFLNPDFTLIGEFDQRSGDLLAHCYSQIMENGAPSKRMSMENAELTKIAVNTFVTTKITFANMIADLCSRIPGGDTDVVTGALGSDMRIGRKYLTGALGYGGPCFPRDNVALSFIAEALGSSAGIATTTDRLNRSLVSRVIDDLGEFFPAGSTAAVLGLSYKPLSHVLEESQGVALANHLCARGVNVIAYDPLVARTGSPLDSRVRTTSSMREAIAAADSVLIANPDPEFSQLRASDFPIRDSVVTVVDFWRILRKSLGDCKHVRYIPYGCSIADEENAARLQELWGDTVTAGVA